MLYDQKSVCFDNRVVTEDGKPEGGDKSIKV